MESNCRIRRSLQVAKNKAMPGQDKQGIICVAEHAGIVIQTRPTLSIFFKSAQRLSTVRYESQHNIEGKMRQGAAPPGEQAVNITPHPLGVGLFWGISH
jgi:hypothetical protein